MFRIPFLASLAYLLIWSGCGNKEEAAEPGEPRAPAEERPLTPEVPVDENVHVGAAGSGGDAGPVPGDPDPGPHELADPAVADTSEQPPTEEGGDEADATPDPQPEKNPVPDLLKEVRNKRTSDKRALAALAEAEKAGATPRELAEAANARGQALFSDSERARRLYEWAADRDRTYPDPIFNLARQAVMSGDIPATKEYLQQVRKRTGGKKLLQQLDFDPTWDIVKDDPEIRKLMK